MGRGQSVIVAGALAFCLIAGSSPRLIGDGREYLAQAVHFASLHGPAFRPADIPSLQSEIARIDPSLGDWDLRASTVADSTRGRVFLHFWFYALLAAPFVWIAHAIGVSAAVRLHGVESGPARARAVGRSSATWRCWRSASLRRTNHLVDGQGTHRDLHVRAADNHVRVAERAALVVDGRGWHRVDAESAHRHRHPSRVRRRFHSRYACVAGSTRRRRRPRWRRIRAAPSRLHLRASRYAVTSSRTDAPGRSHLPEPRSRAVRSDIGIDRKLPDISRRRDGWFGGSDATCTACRRLRRDAGGDYHCGRFSHLVLAHDQHASRWHTKRQPVRAVVDTARHSIAVESERRQPTEHGADFSGGPRSISALVSVVAFHPSVPQNSREPTWLATFLWTRLPGLEQPAAGSVHRN